MTNIVGWLEVYLFRSKTGERQQGESCWQVFSSSHQSGFLYRTRCSKLNGLSSGTFKVYCSNRWKWSDQDANVSGNPVETPSVELLTAPVHNCPRQHVVILQSLETYWLDLDLKVSWSSVTREEENCSLQLFDRLIFQSGCNWRTTSWRWVYHCKVTLKIWWRSLYLGILLIPNSLCLFPLVNNYYEPRTRANWIQSCQRLSQNSLCNSPV